MIYPIVPFPVTSSNPKPRFQGHGVIIDALDVLHAQLTRDLFAIAKFLFYTGTDISATVRPMGVKFCTTVDMGPGQVFFRFRGGIPEIPKIQKILAL